MIESLRLLAASCEDQISSLPSYASVDELGLIFEDCYLFADQLLKYHLLTEEQFNDLKNLNMLLDNMSNEGNENLWTYKSLQNNHKWKCVRQISKHILESLNEPIVKPDLFWIEFISND